MTNLLLQNLNDKQIEAVQTIDGPVLIIAGAGSGKTKTLTHRIAYLIKEKSVDARNILAVTFTNKAAGEMKERVIRLLDASETDSLLLPASSSGRGSNIPFIGTFHSVCVRILRREAKNLNISNNFLIYDADDQISLMKESLKELNISAEQFKPNSILASISMAKNKLQSPADFLEQSGGYFESIAAKCYELYQDKLQKAEALDFDDLIMKIVLAFKNNPQILEKYQNIFKFILVDEYQDTSHLQYQFVNLLAKKHQNLCVVGDDWQSIYKWRGADIANILEFERDYPKAKVILLEQNYRSSQNILDASYGIISKNVNRKDKKLWSAKEKGSSISAAMVCNEKEEGYFIVEKIREIAGAVPALPVETERSRVCPPSSEERKLLYKDFAVLYRTNAQSRVLEEAFIAAGIPYKIVGGLKFYSRKEIKDVLAYLRLILNPYDKVSIARVINLPQRGLGKTTVDKLLKTLEISDRNRPIEEIKIESVDSSKQKAINSFFKLLFVCKEKSKEFSLTKLIDFLLTASGYGTYIQSIDEGEARWENIQELFTAAAKFDKLPCEEGLRIFLEEVALVADTDELEPTNNVVNLMTLHSSKGLEFNNVFIAGMEEGILPHSRIAVNNNPEDLEEERRLCYVGMTRAKERLFLIFTQTRNIYGNTALTRPSRFLRDIPEHLVEFEETSGEFGERVINLDEI